LAINFRSLCVATARNKLVSGDAEIDKWFRNHSLNDHEKRKHVVTCARFEGEDDLLGFYALSTVAENAKHLPEVSFFPFATSLYFPCIQLVYLAVDQPFQNNKHGTAIMGHLIRCFADIGAVIGIPAMIVTPLNENAARFYKRLGFVPYPKGSRLFMPLQTAIATVLEAEQEIEAEEAAGTSEAA
jgi:GNAT superfamily N-acetyltransferase